jgi:hypothetical protein
MLGCHIAKCDLRGAGKMLTQYDKAIAAFLSALIGLLVAFNLPVGWIDQNVILAVTPFIAAIITWIVPNKPPAVPPS